MSATFSQSQISKFKKMVLKSGSKGDAVSYAQGQLNGAGAKLTADGIFGSGTKSAVKAFQKKNKLGADGIVGPKTWEPLSAGKTPPPPREKKKPTKKGAAGSDECTVTVHVVCRAQRGMKSLRDAEVKIHDVNKKTNNKGIAELHVKGGRHKVEVAMKGYEPDNKRPLQLRCVAGKANDVTIQMRETS